jgi:ZIP family zinc transporter
MEDAHHGHNHHHHHHHHHNHSHPHNAATTVDLAGHHHVANNKFLSIGVQTSIAIAIHKIPEVVFPSLSSPID